MTAKHIQFIPISDIGGVVYFLVLLLGLFFVHPSSFAESPLENSTSEFHNESEAGVIIANGNSQTQSYNLKQNNSFSWVENSFHFSSQYLQSSNKGIESARYWQLGLRYERELSKWWSLFAGQNIESDIFAGYERRYNTDVGAKYFVIKKPNNLVWFFESGYRYTSERQVSHHTSSLQFARIYSEIEKYWTPTVSTKYWIEYLPNLETSEDYLFNSEFSLSTLLNNNFSIKSAFLLKHDNQRPLPATVKTDTLLTTSLVAKF